MSYSFFIWMYIFISKIPCLFSFSNLNSLAEFSMLVADFLVHSLICVTCLPNFWSSWSLFQRKLLNGSPARFSSFEPVVEDSNTFEWVLLPDFLCSSGFFLATWRTVGFRSLPFVSEDLPNEQQALRSPAPTTADPTAPLIRKDPSFFNLWVVAPVAGAVRLLPCGRSAFCFSSFQLSRRSFSKCPLPLLSF